MKECIIVHINDGRPLELENENFMLCEEFPRAQERLNRYLRQGYELKQLTPQYSPAVQSEGNFSFYMSGFLACLERDIPEDEKEMFIDNSDEEFYDDELFEDEYPEDVLTNDNENDK